MTTPEHEFVRHSDWGNTWDGVERRKGNTEVFFQLLEAQNEKLELLAGEMREQSAALMSHIKTEEEVVGKIVSAFPYGDIAGHCRYHEETIRRIEERAEFWKKLRYELTKWGLFGLLGWLAMSAWNSFLHGPKG